jgi:microcystin-dependent protein
VVERERVPPPLPPEAPWWGNPGSLFLAAILGLIIGGVLGYALRGNGEASRTSGQGALTRTVTNTHTVVQPKVVVHTHTVTASTVTQAPASAANEQKRVEAEATAKKLEKENEELRRQGEGG